MAQLTRDRLAESEDAVNRLFYDTIFKILLESKDEVNRHKSFEIISNMVNILHRFAKKCMTQASREDLASSHWQAAAIIQLNTC